MDPKVDPTETDPWKKVHPVSLYPDGNEYFSHTGAYYDRNAVDVARASDAAAHAAMKVEIERLKAGKFTAEEIHGFCHDLHGTVDASAFAAGCAEEQRKLYGCAPDRDALDSLKAEHAALRNRIKALIEIWRGRRADKSEAAGRERYGNNPIACSDEFIAGQRKFARGNCKKANELVAALSSSQAPQESSTATRSLPTSATETPLQPSVPNGGDSGIPFEISDLHNEWNKKALAESEKARRIVRSSSQAQDARCPWCGEIPGPAGCCNENTP